MDNAYYVYERFRKDNNSCFYVGRGHGERISHMHRNDKQDYICNTYGYYNKIFKDGLTSEEASLLETERIKYYVDELGYGIDIPGYMDRDEQYYLTNRTFGGEDGCFKKGEQNQQYGVSPKDRMGSHYEEWFEKASQRCKEQIGEKNPNYGNDTLHNILKDNPELKMKWYSRKGSQNGRARCIEMFNQNMELIDTFKTIGDCCQYIKDTNDLKSKIDSMRHHVSNAAKNHTMYRGYYFKFA